MDNTVKDPAVPGTRGEVAGVLPADLALSLRSHALAWLSQANVVGCLLSILLLHPGLSALLAPFGYGRWMPIHMNGHLYGWCSLPLIGVLLATFYPGVGERPARWTLWGWSLALLLGSLSWLAGVTTGKLFIDWHGWARPLLPLAMLGLWVLAAGWEEQRRALPPAADDYPLHRSLRLALLAGLFVVPWAFYWASGREVFPAVNPDGGGATGASLLASTLGILSVYGLVPILLRLPLRDRGLPALGAGGWSLAALPGALKAYGLSVVAGAMVWAFIGHGDASHHAPGQILGLAVLMVWIPLAWWYFRAFVWPRVALPWLLAAFLWWTLLVCTGWLSFLPGFSERLKFTHGLVAHAHVALAGLVASAGWAFLLTLSPLRAPRRWSFFAWQLGCLGQVLALWAIGYLELSDRTGIFLGAPWLSLLFSVRLLSGLVMALTSLLWWMDTRRPLSDIDVVDTEAHGSQHTVAPPCAQSACTPFTLTWMKPERIARYLALVAGLMDFGTGLGLVFLPKLTLTLMLVTVPGAEALVYVRFIGAFVAAVGASYLWALRRPVERLRTVFGVTVLFRLAAGSFTLVAVLAGWIGPAWLTVTAADFSLVALQTWLVGRGIGRNA